MLTDIEIAQSAKLEPIKDVAKKLNIKEEDMFLYGENIAKIKNYRSEERRVGKEC